MTTEPQVEIEAPPISTAPPVWRRALPFAIAGILLVYIVWRLDWPRFLEAVAGIDAVPFIMLSLVFNFALVATDTFAITRVYHSTLVPVRFGDMMTIRWASYLPSLINHHVGQGWLTYFVSRMYKVPVVEAASSTLVVYASTLGALLLFGLASQLLNAAPPWMLPTLGVATVLGVAYLTVIRLRPAALYRFRLVKPLLDLGVRGHLRQVLYRLPHATVLFLGTWLPFHFFGVDIPLGDALALLPVLMIVAALPITPQGLGTRDVIALHLLIGYAPPEVGGAAIAAATLSWVCVITLSQALISAVFLRRARRLMRLSAEGS